MDQAHAQQAAAPEEDKGGVGAEQRREAELEDGPQGGGGDRHLGMRDAEFVKVVHVGEPKYNGRQEDGLGDRGLGQQHQRDTGGAEEDFLRHGTLFETALASEHVIQYAKRWG